MGSRKNERSSHRVRSGGTKGKKCDHIREEIVRTPAESGGAGEVGIVT